MPLALFICLGFVGLLAGWGVRRWRRARDVALIVPAAGEPVDRGALHDLNNTLTSVGGFAELARLYADRPDERDACLAEILRAARRGGAITARLLGRPIATVKDRGALQADRGRHTILVVDDDEAVRTFAAMALEELGYRTLRAADAAEALRLLDDGALIDMLLTDVLMPGLSGVDLARRIGERGACVPVVFMSGYEHRRPANGRVTDKNALCLAKPLDLEALGGAVAAALADPAPFLPRLAPSTAA
ncbi:response regulator [Inquilinus sp. CAU 1745]|uniref:response regulator n=1 Tax=Inquilinus sp. CAU 1745 TaxID=3140369 RepID=UPI00325B4740